MPDDKEKYGELIRQLIPVSELPPQLQKEVINKAEIVKVKKKGFIFKQGDRDDFSFYCLEGEIELLANDQQHNLIKGGSDKARYAMAQLQPRQLSARAKVNSVIMKINRDVLDKMVVLQEKEQADFDEYGGEVDVTEVDFDEMDMDWTTRILQSELFSKMPTANIHALFAMLEPIDYKAGDVVVTQGEPGEHYYIIQEGTCQVSRKPSKGDKEIKLAVLKPGDSFGEEALITETTRNATVSMITDGVLSQLSKENFVDLIKKPTLSSLSYNDAMKLIGEGAEWLDVRFKNEHESSAIPGSLNIPLNMLRLQAEEKLDPQKQYIVYCDTSGRSSTAAFILTGMGFDVFYLDGGLVKNPKVAEQAEPEQAPPPKEEPPKKAEQPPPPPKKEPAEETAKEESASTVDEISKQDIDPEIKSTMLDAELERTNSQLKNFEKEKGKVADEDARKKQEEVERKLKEERTKIEAAKKAAQEEAKRLREQEEAKIKKMQQEASKRMEAEKKKLEEVYSRNAEEMEKLERLKKEAEQRLKEEKERLEREAEGAKSQLEDARRMKKEVEASKKQLEKEVLKRQKEQESLAKKIEQEAREKLEAERRALAEQFANNEKELEMAKREREAAEAARKAAKEEAEKIIAEYKAKNEEDRAAIDEQLKAERMKLEEEQRKIQETLREVNRAKEEAAAAKKAAMEEVRRLKEKQEDKEVTQNKHAEESLQSEIKQAEEKINQATKNLAQAQQAQFKAIAEKHVNQEDIMKQKAKEAELNKQLAEDLSEFREELEQEEKKFTSMASQMDHMKRIKERADAAKNAAEQANENILDEIASQLGNDS